MIFTLLARFVSLTSFFMRYLYYASAAERVKFYSFSLFCPVGFIALLQNPTIDFLPLLAFFIYLSILSAVFQKGLFFSGEIVEFFNSAIKSTGKILFFCISMFSLE